MSKHTPGPWFLSHAITLTNVKGQNGEQICQVRLADKADAHLIASAPELLEACKVMVDLPDSLVCPSAKNHLKQAIAKAEEV